MPKQLNQLMKTELSKRLKALDGGVFVDYQGLNSEKIVSLRASLHKKGARLQVVKNSLARKAFTDLGYDAKKLDAIMTGPIGVVFARDKALGAVGAAKALLDWKRDAKDEIVKVKGGFLEGSVIDAKGVKALSEMPSREQLLAMVAGTLQAPIAGLANSLYGAVAKFAYAIEAVRAKQEKAGA